jgi:hypothetical protein
LLNNNALQGCQRATKNPNSVNFYGLAPDDVGIFYGDVVYCMYGHVVYCTAMWSIVRPFGLFCRHLV